jgi:hypothetical protein
LLFLFWADSSRPNFNSASLNAYRLNAIERIRLVVFCEIVALR